MVSLIQDEKIEANNAKTIMQVKSIKKQKITKLLIKVNKISNSHDFESFYQVQYQCFLNVIDSSRRSSVIIGSSLKDVPRVEIFLDSHLKKAINKIKDEVTLNSHANNKKLHKLQVQETAEQSFKPLLKEVKILQKQQKSSQKITLMPNDVVLNYIKQVYQKYGIQNPLQGYLDFSNKKQIQQLTFSKYPNFSDKKQQQGKTEKCFSIKTQKKQRRISQNQAKILQLKNRFKEEIQEKIEQNTIKKIIGQYNEPASENISQKSINFIKKSQGNITYIDNLTNLIQNQEQDTYDFENDTTINQTGTVEQQTPERSPRHINKFCQQVQKQIQSPQITKPKKKLFVKTKVRSISTKYPSKPETPQNPKHINHVTFNMPTFQSNEKPSRNFNLSAQRKIRIQQDSTIISQPKIQNNKLLHSECYIPQVFRYCLGCQEAVLNSNIVYHENRCQQLKKIANLSVGEIQKIIDSKIRKLNYQLKNSQLFNLTLKDIEQIKSTTENLVKSSQGSQKQYNREDLFKINKLIERKLMKGCGLIKKLEWFSKLKGNIGNHISPVNFNQKPQTKISNFSVL